MPDLYMDITFPLKDPAKFTHETNIKPELVGDILAEFIRSQQGSGEDKNPPVEREVYKLRLELNLSFDNFKLKHDCGNEGLALGIVMDVFKRFPTS